MRGYTTFIVDGKPIRWKLCAVDGCENGVCYRLNSQYCYPHTKYTRLGVGTTVKKVTETAK
jgi:hypothetical protein